MNKTKYLPSESLASRKNRPTATVLWVSWEQGEQGVHLLHRSQDRKARQVLPGGGEKRGEAFTQTGECGTFWEVLDFSMGGGAQAAQARGAGGKPGEETRQ